VDDDGQDEDGGRAVGPGLLLLLCGAMLGWMGLDLLTGGALTRAVSGGALAAADVSSGEGGGDVRAQD
jgi:hypothetical protein